MICESMSFPLHATNVADTEEGKTMVRDKVRVDQHHICQTQNQKLKCEGNFETSG